jgi:hypothetical protein
MTDRQKALAWDSLRESLVETRDNLSPEAKSIADEMLSILVLIENQTIKLAVNP